MMLRFLRIGTLAIVLTALCGDAFASPSAVAEEGGFVNRGGVQTEQEPVAMGAAVGASETRSLSTTRQSSGLWRAGAYVGGRVFRDPFADGDCSGGPCLAANSISFRLGPNLQGRPNVITNLRIQFLATLRKSDGTSEGRSIFFSDTPPDPSVDEFDVTPPLELRSRRGAQTFNFQVRGVDSEVLFQVRLKLTWDNQIKRFTASMNATSGTVDGQQYTARTVLASGPNRVVRDGAGVIVGISGAMRRTGT